MGTIAINCMTLVLVTYMLYMFDIEAFMVVVVQYYRLILPAFITVVFFKAHYNATPFTIHVTISYYSGACCSILVPICIPGTNIYDTITCLLISLPLFAN